MFEHFERYYKAAQGDSLYIEKLLVKNPALLNTPWDGHGATFFYEHLADNQTSVVGYAVAKHKNIKEIIGLNRQWIISFVAVLVEIMDISINTASVGPVLIACELDIILAKNYAKTRKGWTLLQFAAENGQSDVAEHLIEMGADIRNNYLELAIKNGHKNFKKICTQKEQLRIQKEQLRTQKEQLCAQKKQISDQEEKIDELLYVSNELLNKSQTKRPGFFFQPAQLNTPQSQQLLTNQTYQYSDDEIRDLLKIYLADYDLIITPLFPFILQINGEKHNDVEQNFINAVQTAWQNDRISILLINPSQEKTKENYSVDGTHWISLVVEPQKNALMPTLTIMDSLGDTSSKIHIELTKIIRSALSHGGIDISVKTYLLNQQKGDVDCGAWCVDNTVQLIKGKSFRHPHPEKYLNYPPIKDKVTGAELRKTHNALLSEAKSTPPQAKI